MRQYKHHPAYYHFRSHGFRVGCVVCVAPGCKAVLRFGGYTVGNRRAARGIGDYIPYGIAFLPPRYN